MERYTVETNFGQTSFSTIDDAIRALWIALTYSINDFIDFSLLDHIREVILSGETWTDGKGVISIYRSE